MITCEIDPTDPLFAVKLELIETTKNKVNFAIRQNFTIDTSYSALSFLRYVVFDEDPSYLILAKTQCVNAAKDQWVASGRSIEDFAKQKQIFTG